MLLELNIRDRHAAMKAFTLAAVAIESMPNRRRPIGDREAIMLLLRRLEPTEQEMRVYDRAAEWVLREILTEATAEITSQNPLRANPSIQPTTTGESPE